MFGLRTAPRSSLGALFGLNLLCETCVVFTTLCQNVVFTTFLNNVVFTSTTLCQNVVFTTSCQNIKYKKMKLVLLWWNLPLCCTSFKENVICLHLVTKPTLASCPRRNVERHCNSFCPPSYLHFACTHFFYELIVNKLQYLFYIDVRTEIMQYF